MLTWYVGVIGRARGVLRSRGVPPADLQISLKGVTHAPGAVKTIRNLL